MKLDVQGISGRAGALQVTMVPVKNLIPYTKNSRTHDKKQVQQIAESIGEFGFTNPVLVDEEGGIIAGHGRVLAAKVLGLVDVPTITLAGLSEAQKRAYVIADNRLALNAGWDEEMLRLELQALQALDQQAALGFDLGIMGFTPAEMNALLEVKEGGLVEDDEVPVMPVTPKTKLGDVWVMGKHRLLCGDSTKTPEVLKLMNGKLADMLLTDPPYNVAYEGGTGLTIQNDSMDDQLFQKFLADAFIAANAGLRKGGVFYIWHADSEGYNFHGGCRAAGWKVRQSLVWKKSSLVMGRQDYHWIHEPCLFGWADGDKPYYSEHDPCLYGWKDGDAHTWANNRKQTTIMEFAKPKKNKEHPTMKPVALFEYQLRNNTRTGDRVLDTFGGSGTTLIAAEKNARVAYLLELDPKYCDVIVQRWANYTGHTAVLESGAASIAPDPNAGTPDDQPEQAEKKAQTVAE